MKRLLGLFIDVVFFTSFIAVTLVGALYALYRQENDISIINVLLQTDLTRTLLFVYGGLVVLYLLYFWIIPTLLKQTIGQRLAGTTFTAEKRVSFGKVFLKTIVGRFWDILFFPYTFFALIKKRTLVSTKISGITISHKEHAPTKGLYLALAFFVVFLMATLAGGTYVYKTGITPIMERYTNYEKQVKTLIEKLAYQDAAAALEKYKQQRGEDANYSFYHCAIEANLSTELASIDICKAAIEKNNSDIERVKTLTSQIAKVYAANSDYANAEALYSKLWNEYQDRSMDMKNYVMVLSEAGKGKEATAILTVLAQSIPTEDPIALRDLGNLYERIGNTDLAFETYQKAVLLIKESENQSLAGELHYNIGVIYYTKGKYTEATENFNKAKELNKDYAEPVDSYIILINKLKNSVTK